MRIALLALTFVTVSYAARIESPTGSRRTPPTISAISPRGLTRGTTVELTVEGLNLAKASAIYFSDPGVKGRVVNVKELPDLPDVRLGSNGTVSTIDLGPLPPRNQVTVELEVAPETPIGPVDFRLLTPFGTTLPGRVVVEPFYGESPDKEPNDTPEDAFESFLPSILVGAISKPGDVDYFKIHAEVGEELVFSNSGGMLGSPLQPLITVTDEQGKVIREFTLTREHASLAHRFAASGTYYVRVSDPEQGGSGNHTYRVMVGKLPVVLTAYPLGVPMGKTASVALSGYHLGKGTAISVRGEPSSDDPGAIFLRPKTAAGLAFNRVKLALGDGPEVDSASGNSTAAAAQMLTLPAMVNGRVTTPDRYFRFHATKGEKLIAEVNARRLGSPLDSLIEILDADAKPIEIATVRAVSETSMALRDHDSAQRGIRLATSTSLLPGDYLMMGGEIARVETLPPNADNDFIFEATNGERTTFFNTSGEAHALDSPAYKVQIAPPGTKFPANGLPLVHLTVRNDDGGAGYGKDSRLRFTAPADGDYLLRLRDVRGAAGPEYAYRLSIRKPAPSYRLSFTPSNPNVPAGGRVPVTVTALRLEDHNEPIEVDVQDLPAGLHATHGTIQANDFRTTIILSADADATLSGAVPFVIADAKGKLADPEDHLKLIALIPKPDVEMSAETHEAVLTPDHDVEISVKIVRNNGFGGRVPVEVRNLPPGVEVSDTGLNGVLINENETRRTFKLHLLPTARAHTQPIYASGLVETRAGTQQNTFCTEPITLRIVTKPL